MLKLKSAEIPASVVPLCGYIKELSLGEERKTECLEQEKESDRELVNPIQLEHSGNNSTGNSAGS